MRSRPSGRDGDIIDQSGAAQPGSGKHAHGTSRGRVFECVSVFDDNVIDGFEA